MDISILQFFNCHGNVFLDGMARTLTFGWTWLPLYLALFFLTLRNNKTMAQVGIIVSGVFCCVALSGLLSDFIIKPHVARLRPLNDPQVQPLLHLVERFCASGYSFFSSHAANTFSIAMFFTLLTRSVYLSVTLFSWATLNAWTRLYLAAHWPSDVLVGAMWGIATGVVVYIIFYRVFYSVTPKTRYVSTHYTSTGYDHTDIDICISVMVVTVVYAIIKSLVP